MKRFTGVGSRRLPKGTYERLVEIGRTLRHQGYHLLSGMAPGSDNAFEEGAGTDCTSYVPWKTSDAALIRFGAKRSKGEIINISYLPHAVIERLMKTLDECLPATFAPEHIKNIVSKGSTHWLYLRNVCQVTGHGEEADPVEFLVCWAPVDGDGIPLGGTRCAWTIAREMGIPAYNLSVPHEEAMFTEFINRLEK